MASNRGGWGRERCVVRIYPTRRRITKAEKRGNVMDERDMRRSIFSHSYDAALVQRPKKVEIIEDGEEK
jgi:hypothetical protein